MGFFDKILGRSADSRNVHCAGRDVTQEVASSASEAEPSLSREDNTQSYKTCAGCHARMLIISNAFVRREVAMRSQGCFQCAACGCYTCYECSDNRQPCACGQQRWEQRTYVPGPSR